MPIASAAAVTCLSLALYYEARSEPLEGQLAVARVIINRVESPRYPDSVCDVVWAPYQFSFTHDGIPEDPQEEAAWLQSQAIARAVLEDPEGTLPNMRSTYYHANYVAPYWAAVFEHEETIGAHIFYFNPEH